MAIPVLEAVVLNETAVLAEDALPLLWLLDELVADGEVTPVATPVAALIVALVLIRGIATVCFSLGNGQ